MALPPRPTADRDSAFFWQGLESGELRIQRCTACSALRHPPGPMCPGCHGLGWDWVVSAGRGRVHSFVVHHHPPIPGFEPPFVVALVALDEGTRLVANLAGIAPDDVDVGMPVRVEFVRMGDAEGDGGWTLPRFRPTDASG